jgi:hypothetical protein
MSVTLADYIRPHKPMVKIWDKDKANLYHTYDSFNMPGNTINVTDIDVTLAYGAAGSFGVLIEDSGGALNPNVGLGSKVLVASGKFSANYELIQGYVRRHRRFRDDTGVLRHLLAGYGSKIRYNERLTNFHRVGKKTAFGSTEWDRTDSNMKASELFKDIVQDTDHLPIKGPAEAALQADLSQVSSQVNEFIPSISLRFAEWAKVADKIADTVGAVWGVDVGQSPMYNDRPFLRYPTLKHSGIIIKDVEEIVSGKDTENVSYFVGPWNFEDSMEVSDGFANRLYGRGKTAQNVDQANTDVPATPAYYELYNKEVGFKFTPKSARFDGISLLLSKVGNPTGIWGNGVVHGHVQTDDNGSPGRKVGAFDIPIASIGTSATAFDNIQLWWIAEGIQWDKPHWVVIYATGGDANNTVRLHHDNKTGGTVATRTGANIGHESTAAWTVQTGQPAPNFTTVEVGSILAECSDGDSIKKYGLVEAVVDAEWITDGEAMDRLLAGILEYSAKPKRFYETKRVTMPRKAFFPGELVTIVDSKSGLDRSTRAEIMEVRYKFRATQFGLGCRYAEITPVGYVGL